MRAIDVDELRRKVATLATIAKSDQQKALLGRVFYIMDNMPTIHPKPERESKAMLPCICGYKLREHWYSADEAKREGLKCRRCGFEVWGKNATDVIRKWNKAVREAKGSD